MKEGWTIKPILDICDVYQPQTISTSKLIANAPYDVFGANGCIGKYNQYNHEEDEVLLTCRGATCGNINRSTPKAWINGNAMVIHPKSNELSKDFLTFLLKAIDYSHIITGTAQPQITRTSLSAVQLPIPTPTAQQQIVSFLDAQFAKIDAIKANAEKQLQEAKALFQNALKDLLMPEEKWTEYKLPTLCKDLFAGGDAPIDKSKEQSNEYLYPIYSNGIENAGLYGYSKSFRVQECALTISARGTIGAVFIRKEPFTPIVRLITLIPNKEIILIDFFYYLLINCNLGNTGSSIPQLTIPNLRELKFHLPSIDAQKVIADKLDSLASKVKKLHSNYSQTITLCEDLKKSLLKDIFS